MHKELYDCICYRYIRQRIFAVPGSTDRSALYSAVVRRQPGSLDRLHVVFSGGVIVWLQPRATACEVHPTEVAIGPSPWLLAVSLLMLPIRPTDDWLPAGGSANPALAMFSCYIIRGRSPGIGRYGKATQQLGA